MWPGASIKCYVTLDECYLDDCVDQAVSWDTGQVPCLYWIMRDNCGHTQDCGGSECSASRRRQLSRDTQGAPNSELGSYQYCLLSRHTDCITRVKIDILELKITIQSNIQSECCPLILTVNILVW